MTIINSQESGEGEGYESESDLGDAEGESNTHVNVEEEDASLDEEDYEAGEDFDVPTCPRSCPGLAWPSRPISLKASRHSHTR